MTMGRRLPERPRDPGPAAERRTAVPKLRVRIGQAYPYAFNVDLGQRNARFVKRPLTPLKRYVHWGDAFTLLPEPGYDLAHTFNAVPLVTRGRPYVITFESYLPRIPADRPQPRLEKWLRRRLYSDRCHALIAQSEYAVRQFRRQNATEEHLPELLRKISVIYPTVSVRRETPKLSLPGAPMKLLFVGKDFMRKGGPAVLRAHRTLRRELPVETTIVSELRWRPDDYIGPPSASYVESELRGLGQEGLTIHPELPNARVLELMAEADFFVFPTLHETFGAAPLEALASATPAITTATAAQPEIVEHGVSGFLLPFENDDHVGKWPWIDRPRGPEYLEVYDTTIARLAAALAHRLLEFWPNRDDYPRLSAGALERVRDRFDRTAARDRLEALYEECRPYLR